MVSPEVYQRFVQESHKIYRRAMTNQSQAVRDSKAPRQSHVDRQTRRAGHANPETGFFAFCKYKFIFEAIAEKLKKEKNGRKENWTNLMTSIYKKKRPNT